MCFTVYSMMEEGIPQEDLLCCICLQPLAGPDTISTTQCGHVLHSLCLHRSLEGHPHCPICRVPNPRVIRLWINPLLMSGGRDIAELVEEPSAERFLLNLEISRLTALVANPGSDHVPITVHESQIAGWIQNHNEAQEVRMGLEADLRLERELNADLRRQVLELQPRVEENTVLQRSLTDEQGLQVQMRNAFRDLQSKVTDEEWGRNRLTIKRFATYMLNNPKREVLKVLLAVGMRIDAPQIHIEWAGTSLNRPSEAEVIVEFPETFTKMEFVIRFARLKNGANEAYRVLTIRDGMDTKMLYRKVNDHLRQKTGIIHLGLKHNRVVISTILERGKLEIEDEAQMVQLGRKLDRLPESEAARRRRLRRDFPDDDGPSTSAAAARQRYR